MYDFKNDIDISEQFAKSSLKPSYQSFDISFELFVQLCINEPFLPLFHSGDGDFVGWQGRNSPGKFPLHQSDLGLIHLHQSELRSVPFPPFRAQD